MPASPSRSTTSKNSLNRPLYEALKIGLTAIRPSAPRTASIAAWSFGLGKPVRRWFVRSWACSRSSTTSTVGVDPALAEMALRGGGEAIREEPRRRRLAEAGADDDERSIRGGHAGTATAGRSAPAGARRMVSAAAARRLRGRDPRVDAALRHVGRLEGRELAPEDRHDELAEHLDLLEHDRQRQPGVVDEEQLALVVTDELAEAERPLDHLVRAPDGQRRLGHEVLERRAAAVDRGVVEVRPELADRVLGVRCA